MKTLFRNSVMMGLLLGAWSAVAQAQAPVLLFTDIITGANSGGEGGNGVYITIYGKNFGATQGSSTVTVGGAAVAQYKVWGSRNGINPALDKVVVQIGPSNATGNIVMTVNGQQSNALPFTVSSGHIYFVSPSGSDSNPGTFASPWTSVVKAKNTMAAGDTVYIRAGTYASVENFSASLYCGGACTGTATAYQNFVGYPGETATIGSGSVTRGIYNWTSVMQYATFAELTIRAGTSGFTCQNNSSVSCNWLRIIGNDMRSTGTGEGFDLEMPASNIVVYGNDSANNCTGGGCDYNNRAYSLYLGGYGAQSNIDLGWNSLHDNPFGKGIQVYGHIAGDTISGLKIHDNAIYNNTMVGILLGGSDGGTDFVQNAQVYNNLIWNNSTGADAGHMNFGGIAIQSLGANVDTYQIYNNTFYNNSPAHSGVQAGGSITFQQSGTHSVTLKNNIFYGSSGSPCYFYFDDASSPTRLNVTFSNNLYFGAGTGPNGCNWNVGSLSVNSDAAAVNANPQFVNVVTLDFSLLSGSLAIGAGATTAPLPLFDYAGKIRPSPPSIGAYELVSGTVNRPLPPTNLSVVVQ